MDQLLTTISYWITLTLLIITFVFVTVYLAARGLCAYRKVTETVTKEQFELLGEAETAKGETPVPVHSPVN